jgi:hypothetical protein
MSDFVKDLTASLQKQIEAYTPKIEAQDVGSVLEAGDGRTLSVSLLQQRGPGITAHPCKSRQRPGQILA